VASTYIYPLTPPPTYSLQQAPTYLLGTMINASAVTTAQSTGILTVTHFKGITVVLNVTSFGGSTLVVTVNGVDPTTQNTWALLTSGNITSTATTAFTLYPGINQPAAAPANASYQVSTILPSLVSVSVAVSAGTASFTATGILTT
jgi:hypothetical protein